MKKVLLCILDLQRRVKRVISIFRALYVLTMAGCNQLTAIWRHQHTQQPL